MINRETIRYTLASWAAVACCGAVLFWALPGHSAGNGNGNGNIGSFNGNGNSGNDNGNGNIGNYNGNWNWSSGNGNGYRGNNSGNGRGPVILPNSAELGLPPDLLLRLQRLWAQTIPPFQVHTVPFPHGMDEPPAPDGETLAR